MLWIYQIIFADVLRSSIDPGLPSRGRTVLLGGGAGGHHVHSQPGLLLGPHQGGHLPAHGAGLSSHVYFHGAATQSNIFNNLISFFTSNYKCKE